MADGRGKGEWHITAELLESLTLGEIDPGVYLTLLLEHLVRLCPDCRAGVETFSSGAPTPAGAARPSYESLIDRAAAPALAFHEMEERAQRSLAVLEALPDHPLRLAAVRTGMLAAGANPALVELLLEGGRRRIHDSPAAALEAAELAVEVARRLPGGPYGATFCRERLAEARAHQANALRVIGDLRKAEGVMTEAAELLEGSADDFLRAEMASFAASLAKDQLRWPEARTRLDLAERLFNAVGADPRTIVRVRLSRAEVEFCAGDAEEAVVMARATLEAADAESMPELYFIAHHNLAGYLCDIGEHEEARRLVEAVEPLYRAHPDRSFRLRRVWLDGRIAWGAGELATAEERFRAARDGFVEDGLGYPAALVALDLAALHLEQGRTAEVREIAAWTTALFKANDIHREALAALTLFRQAAVQDVVTVHEIRRLARHLTELQRHPAARSELAS